MFTITITVLLIIIVIIIIRRRTTSQTYMVATGFTSASPPKFVSLEEIMQAANSMRDMALVHHIAVDDNFILKRYEPDENSLHQVVKDTVHRAFWDVLREELNESPPTYKQVRIVERKYLMCPTHNT